MNNYEIEGRMTNIFEVLGIKIKMGSNKHIFLLSLAKYRRKPSVLKPRHISLWAQRNTPTVLTKVVNQNTQKSCHIPEPTDSCSKKITSGTWNCEILQILTPTKTVVGIRFLSRGEFRHFESKNPWVKKKNNLENVVVVVYVKNVCVVVYLCTWRLSWSELMSYSEIAGEKKSGAQGKRGEILIWERLFGLKLDYKFRFQL